MQKHLWKCMQNACENVCENACKNTCENACKNACENVWNRENACKNTCENACKNTCENACKMLVKMFVKMHAKTLVKMHAKMHVKMCEIVNMHAKTLVKMHAKTLVKMHAKCLWKCLWKCMQKHLWKCMQKHLWKCVKTLVKMHCTHWMPSLRSTGKALTAPASCSRSTWRIAGGQKGIAHSDSLRWRTEAYRTDRRRDAHLVGLHFGHQVFKRSQAAEAHHALGLLAAQSLDFRHARPAQHDLFPTQVVLELCVVRRLAAKHEETSEKQILKQTQL